MGLFNIQIAFFALVILTVVAAAFFIFKAHKSGLLKTMYTRMKGTRFSTPVLEINLEPQLPAPVTPVPDLPQRSLFQITNFERIEYFSTPQRQAAIH